MRKGRRIFLGVLAVAAGVVASAFGQANIVKDFGFESPPFSGDYLTLNAGQKFGFWTVGSGPIDRVNSKRLFSHTGGRSVDLNACAPGSVYQDITTTPGTSYKLTFAMAGNPEGGAGTKTMSVRWGGSEVARKTFNTAGKSRTKMGWVVRSYTVRASAAKTRLEFVSLTPGCTGPMVDSASLSVGSAGDEPPPPVAGKSVVADVVSGVVFVSVPQGKSIRRGKKSVVARTAKFRRFKGRANIPVGSLVDTRKGRIALTAASDRKGGTQDGEFYDGVFQIKQAKAAKITDALLLTSRAKCGKGSAHASAGRKLGRLWAKAKGRFRTRGRYSAASVRGTTWLVEDRCDGTFTKVSRGQVSVRDNVKRKTILLTAGQSYFARAQRASSKP